MTASLSQPLTGHEDREPDVPPCDSLAEGIVLYHMLYWPDDLAQCDLEPLMVFPEHQRLLAAMQAARARTAAGQAWSEFYIAWMAECEKISPHLDAVLDTVVADHWTWHMNRVRDDPDSAVIDVRLHDWRWWLARLQRVAAARQLVEDAHQIAARAWRGDVDGARAVVDRIDRRREKVRIEV